jgi:RNA polymerase sigma-70 factor (ECF subfamily)
MHTHRSPETRSGQKRRHQTPRRSAPGDNDGELLSAVAQHDQEAFRDLHVRYDGRIQRFISKSFPHCTSVEEVVSDTLWIVWQTAGQFRGAAQVSTWIMGIAYRVCLKSLRKSTRRSALLSGGSTQPQVREAMHDPCAEGDLQEWIAAGLPCLPDDQRTALELAYRDGHSCAEIALALNCPVGTVKTRMYHGRQRLKYTLPLLAGPHRTVEASKSGRSGLQSPLSRAAGPRPPGAPRIESCA